MQEIKTVTKNGIEVGFVNSKSDIELINKRLENIYGKDDLGDPKFRIVFSDDLFEKREVNVVGDLGIHLARKYSYIKSKWVFEVKAFNEQDNYECFFVFSDKKGKALPVQWKVVELLVTMWMHREEPEFFLPMPTEEEAMEADYQYFLEVISDECTDFGSSIREGETIILSGKEFK